ncbi:MAG: RluA family pseudouridine synthase [Bacilli bacterium]|nr:RluA family pseudouridine synthase [Bacilli bacterium]
MRKLIVKANEKGQRIDKYIRKYLNNAPLSYIYKLFRKKDIKVNNRRVDINYIVCENDEISIYASEDTLNEFNVKNTIATSNNTIDIIYEDENILVINKDPGILVHEGEENTKTNTLNNDILNYLKNKGEYSEEDIFTPSCVHRLDRNTSGVIIAAKNLLASKELLELFKNKENLTKEYIALVNGKTNNDGTIDAPLLKNEKDKYVRVDKHGLTAITKYKRLTFNDKYSLLKVNILTGRTHQIRVHMAYIDHHLVNDDKYGNFNANKEFNSIYKYKYQFLHSYMITFSNIKGPLSYLSNKTFKAPLKTKQIQILSDLFKDLIIEEI